MSRNINNLKVGDVVTGTHLADKYYKFTTSKATMKVLSIDENRVHLQIMTHTLFPSFVGHKYYESINHFKRVSEQDEDNEI